MLENSHFWQLFFRNSIFVSFSLTVNEAARFASLKILLAWILSIISASLSGWVVGVFRMKDMVRTISKRRASAKLTSAFSAGLIGAALIASDVSAQTLGDTDGQRTQFGQRYVPGIWVDPDGCEHWVIDDGIEGFMTPHVTRDGIPVCRRGNLCGVVESDQMFATDSARIGAAGRERLRNFFRSSSAASFIITGHTDSRASDAYNLELSQRRANSVAAVAREVGARVASVRGLGERQPRATNGTREGQALNRRVEIVCQGGS